MAEDESARPVARREFLLEDPAWAEQRVRRRRWLWRTGGAAMVVSALAVAVTAATRAHARRAAAHRVVSQDLERLAQVQDLYFRERGRFASLEDLGTRYVGSQGVWIWVDRADTTAWEARGSHGRVEVTCSITGAAGRVDQVRCD